MTTKILAAGKDAEDTYAKCVKSVQLIDPSKDGYVDLFLIHSARAGKEFRRNVWQALERLYSEGKARSIGVSNWGIGHIEELKPFAKVWPPHVNQIEVRLTSSFFPIHYICQTLLALSCAACMLS